MMNSVKPALSIAHITHTNSQHHYEIISINGLPFYQSSGNQSTFPNTWFPFFGLLEKATNTFYHQGWFIKAMTSKLPKSIYDKITELLPSYGSDCPGGRDLSLRFWNVPCLLLSSSLGGGFWEGKKGQALKAFLQTEFPDYYQQIPTLTVMPSSEAIPNHLEVNQWLCAQAKLNDYRELQNSFPSTLPDMLKRLDITPNTATANETRAPLKRTLVHKKPSTRLLVASSEVSPSFFSMPALMYTAGITFSLAFLGTPALLCALGVICCFGAVLTVERLTHKKPAALVLATRAKPVQKLSKASTQGKLTKTWLPSANLAHPTEMAKSPNETPRPLKGILRKR